LNSNLPPFAAAVSVANIRLAGDGDDRFLVGGAGGSSGHGHKGGDQKLSQQIQIFTNLFPKLNIQWRALTSFMLN
jgi:hypothetical protein